MVAHRSERCVQIVAVEDGPLVGPDHPHVLADRLDGVLAPAVDQSSKLVAAVLCTVRCSGDAFAALEVQDLKVELLDRVGGESGSGVEHTVVSGHGGPFVLK